MAQILKERNQLYDIYLEYVDDPTLGQASYFAEAFVKVKGGIRHFVQWYRSQPTADEIYREALATGHFSPRPYRLAQGCDGSIGDAVFCLFGAFCKACGLDPEELYLQAYPDDRKLGLEESEVAGNWQGVRYPRRWGQKQFAGLIESLTEINNHSLVGVLLDIAGQLGYTSPY